jgi:small GTP-binding protein
MDAEPTVLGPARVLFIGECDVGKTSLLFCRLNLAFESDRRNTIATSLFPWHQTLSDGDTIKLELYDTAGQERYRALTTSYFHNAHVAIVCCTVEVPYSKKLSSVQEWCQHLRIHAPSFCSVIIAMTKSDLLESDEDRARAIAELNELRAASGAKNGFLTSAKVQEGVEELFEAVAELSRGKIQAPIRIEEVEKRGCCSS